jgi:hypothetical protein
MEGAATGATGIERCLYARRAGLLVGPSAGANVWACILMARRRPREDHLHGPAGQGGTVFLHQSHPGTEKALPEKGKSFPSMPLHPDGHFFSIIISMSYK